MPGLIDFARLSGVFTIAHRPNELPPLDYASSASRPKSIPASPIATVVGSMMGLVGAFMLCYGIQGIVLLVRNFSRADSKLFFGVAFLNIIGTFLLIVAIRWIRSTTKSSR